MNIIFDFNKNYFLRHEIITRDYYFNKKLDAYCFAEEVKRKGGIVLYLGTNFNNDIPYDYRLSIEIEKTYEIHKNTNK